MSEHYTATVRNLKDFVYLLNDKTESKECLEMVQSYNVDHTFYLAVMDLIEAYRKSVIKKISALFLREEKALTELEEVNPNNFSIEDYKTVGEIYSKDKRAISLMKRLEKYNETLNQEIKKLTKQEYDDNFACLCCCEFQDWID